MKKTRRTFLLAGSIAPVALSVSYAKGNAQMTTYNTGNPLGSKEVKDLFDNAQNFDNFANNRQAIHWPDRFGKDRLTWHGIEEQFQEFLVNAGYQDIGEYAAGLELTARNQVFFKDGELYRASTALALPYTLTGDWLQEKGLFVAMGDAALRQQLADASNPEAGPSMIGYSDEFPSGGPSLREAVGNARDLLYANDVRKFGVFPNVPGSQLPLLVGKEIPKVLLFPAGTYTLGYIPVGVFEGVTFKSLGDGQVIIRVGPLGSAQDFILGEGVTLKYQESSDRIWRRGVTDNKASAIAPYQAPTIDDWETRQFNFRPTELGSINLTTGAWNGITTWPGDGAPRRAMNAGGSGLAQGVATFPRPYEVISACLDYEDNDPRGVFINGNAVDFTLTSHNDGKSFVLRRFVNGVQQGSDSIYTPFNTYGKPFESRYAKLGIEPLNDNYFVFLINDVPLIHPLECGGIRRCGFFIAGVDKWRAVFGLQIDKRRHLNHLVQNRSVCIHGDSTAVPYPYTWDKFLTDYLLGHGEYNVNVINHAVSGLTTSGVRDRMQDVGFGNADVVVVCAGTNDAQGFLGEEALNIYLDQIINLVDGRRLVWIEPYFWYTRDDTPDGTGGDSQNPQHAARVRAQIQAKISSLYNGVYVPTTRLLPHPGANLLSKNLDPLIRDNIHQTDLLHRAYAKLAADGIIKSYGKKSAIKNIPQAAFVVSAASSVNLSGSVNEDGLVTISGTITTNANASRLTLPAGLLYRPIYPVLIKKPTSTIPGFLERQTDGSYMTTGAVLVSGDVIVLNITESIAL